jgi:hypothetical protein
MNYQHLWEGAVQTIDYLMQDSQVGNWLEVLDETVIILEATMNALEVN